MRYSYGWISTLAFAMSVTATGSLAAVSVSQIDKSGRFAHLAITGEISKTDVEKFDVLVRRLRPRIKIIDVELNSTGGDVVAAIAIGNIIRSQSIWTVASDGEGTECASACVLILAAGVVRIAGDDTRVEIHRPYFLQSDFAKLDHPAAQRQYSELTRVVREYLGKMGMSATLFEDMLRVPSDQGRTLSFDEMKAYGLAGWDPAYQEWTKARAKH